MAKSVASGFTISGLLDRNASTRSDYPVERIPVGEIADHPANAAYSMDDAGIAQLARSIKEEGNHKTLHLGVAGLGGDGAMLVAIAAARYRPLAQRGVA